MPEFTYASFTFVSEQSLKSIRSPKTEEDSALQIQMYLRRSDLFMQHNFGNMQKVE